MSGRISMSHAASGVSITAPLDGGESVMTAPVRCPECQVIFEGTFKASEKKTGADQTCPKGHRFLEGDPVLMFIQWTEVGHIRHRMVLRCEFSREVATELAGLLQDRGKDNPMSDAETKRMNELIDGVVFPPS